MDIEKLIEHLKTCARLGDSPIMDGFAVIADKRKLEDAATALSMLQGENKRLNKIVRSIPTTPDSGRTVSQYDKEMSMCVYLGDLEAENEKLRAELKEAEMKIDSLLDEEEKVAFYPFGVEKED